MSSVPPRCKNRTALAALTLALGRATIGDTSGAPPVREGRILSQPADRRRSSAHDPLLALRQPNFLFYAVSRLTSATGTTLLQAAIAWQVYQISGSALQLGLLGLARFVPALGLGLVGGALADAYDRRRIVQAAQLAPVLCAAVLLLATRSGAASVPLIYVLALLIAIAAAFENPARQALLPQVVSRDTFANAVAVANTFQQLGFVSGPAISGVVIATVGIAGAYGAYVVLLVLSVLSLALLRATPRTGARRAISAAAIMEGVRFVRQRQVLVGCMTLDMFAVIFGGATALLPVYAEDILKVGPRGYGLLTSSQSLGSFVTAVVMVMLPPVRRTGRALLFAVTGFGLATVAFGLSRSFPLSLAAYALTGIADQVSVVMRQTTIQLATPDDLRGRVSSVSSLFIGASNQIGSMESGFVAALTSATFSVVSGGLGCLTVVALVAARLPELRRYRINAPAPSESPVLIKR